MAFTTLFVTVSMIVIANAGFPGWPNNDSPFSGFPSPMLPVFPTITFPPLPSAADIANAKPGNGGTFTGVMISSKTEAKRKEDGTIVKETGSTVLMNNDGVVTVKKTGNAPDLPTNAPPTTPFVFADSKIPPPKFQFKHFGFRHFIDPKKIESYVPGKDETFVAHSSNVRSFSTNDNGKISQGGSFDAVVNHNGRVNKQHYTFGTPP